MEVYKCEEKTVDIVKENKKIITDKGGFFILVGIIICCIKKIEKTKIAAK